MFATVAILNLNHMTRNLHTVAASLFGDCINVQRTHCAISITNKDELLKEPVAVLPPSMYTNGLKRIVCGLVEAGVNTPEIVSCRVIKSARSYIGMLIPRII